MVDTDSATDLEWSLLRACCSLNPEGKQPQPLREFITSDLNWSRLFELGERHGVLPLLHQSLAPVRSHVPPVQSAALERAQLANLHKALFLCRELIRVVETMEERNIQVLPYKGVALAESLYGDIALRQSGDIDLLILPQDLPRVREAALQLGYVAHAKLSEAEEREFLKSGYELSFDGPAGPNLLEVQWAIQPRFYAVDFDIERVFQRAVDVCVAGRKMRTPSLEDSFIILALHAAKHMWARLIWICDLARIMAIAHVDWKEVAARATDLGIVRILRVSSILGRRFLETTIPVALDESLPTDLHAETIAGDIESQILNGTTPDVDSLSYFRFMIRLRERKADRLTFMTRLAFTAGPGEWACVHLPESMFPLYRIVRLGRLAAKLARR